MHNWLKSVEIFWVREVLLFLLLFVIMVINDREGLIDAHALRDGCFIFLFLYLHVQFQRFLVLPLLIRKDYLLYAGCSGFTVLLFSTAAYLFDREMQMVGWYDEDTANHLRLYSYYVLCCILSLLMLLLVFFIIAYYRVQQKETDHQLLLKDMELHLLRAQLNPHFLFNSLNNLYGISLKKPAQVPEKIMQMAEIMRYQLESSRRKFVSLQEEISFLRQFILTETDRLPEGYQVSFQLEDTGGKELLQIAPMILICFVENAFKHFDPSAKRGYIRILAVQDAFGLTLSIANSCAAEEKITATTKMGLQNVRQRLDILYPGSYRLEYARKGTCFSLTFELAQLAMLP